MIIYKSKLLASLILINFIIENLSVCLIIYQLSYFIMLTRFEYHNYISIETDNDNNTPCFHERDFQSVETRGKVERVHE